MAITFLKFVADTSKAPFLKRIVLFPFPGLDTASFTKVIPYLERIHFKEWSSKELLYPHNFLENLFEKSIRLHEIWISIGLENCKSVENILIAVATSGRYSFLTKLHIAYLRLSHLEILMELVLQRQGRLRLSYFRIEALAHDVPTSMFEAFLRTQSVNIKELYCRRFLGSSKFGKFTFPRMIGLRKLDCELSARQVMPLKCNLRFPNLQSLNLFGTCCQIFSFDQQFSGNKVSESLTSLHFRPGLIVAGSIAGLAAHFPNIRSLTLSVISKVDLKELLQSWEMMEDLELYFGDGITNIDSLLTGLPAEQCVRVVERIKSNKKLPFGLDFLIKTLDGMLDANDKHVAVSLRNFKNLKTLHLEYNAFLMSRNPAVNEVENNHDNDDEVNEIRPADLEVELEESYLPSDVTGYFALARMKSLRKINLPECLFSEECCNYLIESMELVGWRFCAEASDIVPPRKA
ncbi:unnamed protein product [Orchesella dallaii]|uniref:Uncharacterized protein n=1 Tax=Orchesella dallaii TaxID=48710 RepID=A0ABP1QAA4_9HEXA